MTGKLQHESTNDINTYIQSISFTVLRRGALGVWTCRKTEDRKIAIPQSGRLRKKSQRHAPEAASAPPMGGPMALPEG